MKNIVFYYFSGTGNSKRVAEWIADSASERNINVQLIDISKTNRKNIQKVSGDSLVGFCSPTHGFNYPPVMINFILRFPRSKGSKVFLMNTRAGFKIGKFFLPGLSGIALILPSTVLWLKGYKITGLKSIDLPTNWISLHPGMKDKTIQSVFAHCKIKTRKFSDKILEGERSYTALYELPVDFLIAPVSFFYYVTGRFIFAKSFYATKKCTNCEICMKQCPVKAISFVDKRPFWSYRCESCMHCMNICPQLAIETAHGFIIGTLILLSSIVQYYIYKPLTEGSVPFLSELYQHTAIVRFLIQTILLFISIIISYRIFHYLRRFKPFEWLVNHTSLTFYKFWRRYKPSKNLIS
jgi:Pyruvate/2-oxoacid:ferredoxin oxidoreductase delta subunit